jgi:hypothetical protein
LRGTWRSAADPVSAARDIGRIRAPGPGSCLNYAAAGGAPEPVVTVPHSEIGVPYAGLRVSATWSPADVFPDRDVRAQCRAVKRRGTLFPTHFATDPAGDTSSDRRTRLARKSEKLRTSRRGIRPEPSVATPTDRPPCNSWSREKRLSSFSYALAGCFRPRWPAHLRLMYVNRFLPSNPQARIATSSKRQQEE